MRRATWISTAAAAFAMGTLCVACSSYKAASPENFTRALNGYYEDHDDCLFPNTLHFPYEVGTKGEAGGLSTKLDALTDAGLLQRTEEQSIHIKRYSLTSYASTRVTGRFCYGHRVVTSIDSFTPPATVQGQQTTQVGYHYKMMDVPGWAQSNQMRTAFPALAKSTSNQPQDTAALVLTINGWRVPE